MLSIIIAYQHTKEREKLFLACIDALFRHGVHKFARICVHELGETRTVPQEIERKCVYLFSKRKESFNRAWAFNVAVKKLTVGGMVLVMDADIVPSPRWVAELRDKVRHKSIYAAWGRMFCLNEKGTEYYLSNQTLDPKFYKANNFVEKVKQPSIDGSAGGATLFPRRLFMALKGFPEVFGNNWGGEDNLFFAKALACGNQFMAFRSPMSHLYHSGKQKRQPVHKKLAKSMLRWRQPAWLAYLRDLNGNWGIVPGDGRSDNRITMLVDVPGWAWDVKTRQIIKHLKERFDIRLMYVNQVKELPLGQRGICFTYDPSPNLMAHAKKFEQYITGVTAHTFVNFRNFGRALRRAVAIHANSVLLHNMIRQYHEKVFYVPNGVDEQHFCFRERDASKPFTVGYVGKPTPPKGFKEFIVPACKKAGVPLKAQAIKARRPGVIPHSDMPKFYEDIDVILIASTMDGTPNQMLEAAATGRTFIGNRIGNVPQFLENGDNPNGFLVEKNIDAYVEKILFLKKNREACVAMGVEARKTVEKAWTWQKQSERYAKLFVEATK